MAMQMKSLPKDALVIMSIMRDMGIEEYEPRVINQLLEFTYRKYEWGKSQVRVFSGLQKWFKASDLVLNFDNELYEIFQKIVLLITTAVRTSNPTNFIKFATNNETCSINIGYDNNRRSKNNKIP
jgi:transcription initiation factor TFIID subunit 9B